MTVVNKLIQTVAKHKDLGNTIGLPSTYFCRRCISFQLIRMCIYSSIYLLHACITTIYLDMVEEGKINCNCPYSENRNCGKESISLPSEKRKLHETYIRYKSILKLPQSSYIFLYLIQSYQHSEDAHEVNRRSWIWR